MRAEIIFIVGPTAVGKSAVAVELAERLGGEIVSADSMQLYRGIEILSAAPGPAERARIPHHLVGVLDTAERCDAARYAAMAAAEIRAVRSGKKFPIVVGGSGMYVRALLDGIFEGPGRDPALREALEREAHERGSGALHERLRRRDPRAAEKIHPRDLRRIIRALEVVEACGRPLSEMHREWEEGLAGLTSPVIFTSRNLGLPTAIIGLRRARRDLRERIGRRVGRMFEAGAIDEVRRLRAVKGARDATIGQALGLKEITGYLEGRCSAGEARGAVEKKTCALAKRQMTWFGRDPRIAWHDVPEGETAARTAEAVVGIIGRMPSAE